MLETSPAPAAGLLVLANVPPAGAPGTALAPEATDALTVATSLLPPLVPKVAAVAVAPDGVELQLVAGGKVRLGPATDVLAEVGRGGHGVEPGSTCSICARSTCASRPHHP